MTDVISLDLARSRRELSDALGDDAEHVLAEIRLILAEAERDPGLKRALLWVMEAVG